MKLLLLGLSRISSPLSGRFLVRILAAAIALSPVGVFAQAYPDKPVTIVVPYAAGGPTDGASRILTNKLRAILGQPVIVENRPGAATMVGAAAVAKAPKDGYTLLMITASTVATNPHLYKTMNYKVEDFAPISMVVKVPFVLSIKNSLPVKTIQELIAYAKQRPGLVTYGTSGTGSTPQLAAELFARAAGIKLQEVPYKGSTMALNDLLTEVLDVAIDGVSTSAPQHKAGKVRSLASFARERSDQMPDVPTFVESGLPDVVVYTWFALCAPAGTPDAIVRKLNQAVREAIADPETKERLTSVGFVPESSSPEELGAYVQQEYQLWGKVIKDAGIKIEQ